MNAAKATAWAFIVCAVSVLCAGCASQQKSAQPDPPTSAQAGETTIVAIAPPKHAPTTLPQFLGLNDLFAGIGKLVSCAINRLGSRFPGLEPGPPLTAISDPANAESPTPAVSAAAKVKAEEDAAGQKIKALRYLATIGCGGCYPDVEDAILAALDDCTEEVRYEAVRALRTAAGSPCKFCRSSSCCSPKVLAKLDKIANEMDDQGCYKEPSERVRRLARVASAACGGSASSVEELPREGPTLEPPPESPREGPNLGASVDQTVPSDQAALPSADQYAVRQVAFESDKSIRGEHLQRPDRLPGHYRVRWERITATTHDFPSRERARQTIQTIRDRALGQAAAAPDSSDVARLETKSYDWTSPDSLPSLPMQRALAETRIGEISGAFEDSYGVHLVRVVARQPVAHGGSANIAP